MKPVVIPKLAVVGEITAALAKLASALDGEDAAAHSTAVTECEAALARTFDVDELFGLIRLVKEARVQCRICKRCHGWARTDLGLCRECARQARAAAEA